MIKWSICLGVYLSPIAGRRTCQILKYIMFPFYVFSLNSYPRFFCYQRFYYLMFAKSIQRMGAKSPKNPEISIPYLHGSNIVNCYKRETCRPLIVTCQWGKLKLRYWIALLQLFNIKNKFYVYRVAHWLFQSIIWKR